MPPTDPQLFAPFANGLLLCLGLIAAIGVQNSYVLRQGLKREYHWLVAGVCTLSDFALILLGTTGLGAFIARVAWLEAGFYLFGAAFLAVYTYRALRDAWHGDQSIGLATDGPRQTAGKVVLATLGFTWLNPHAWLDTTVLVGAFSAQYAGASHWAFTAGAMSASWIWFFGLSLLAARLSPWLTRPAVWRVINAVIGLVMAYVGLRFLMAGVAGLRQLLG
ncbi:LysE/ArgO family amino acid transporter [Acidihalobacter ferrooxydans]|uniref:Lysine transporter LysE n=1 Tax=Acidihalobacter ferrooxydans TaxID=1765967 RepID=A0A1P8UK46_9GAMM|nr:LysE/ArgO family amino acid transporter [Acidihalobacter ferrooxydans]APZ44208.1 hypothetical protein BW247_14850 [Acidihalobacter ferrooxydans]